jgi:hypothetical protein
VMLPVRGILGPGPYLSAAYEQLQKRAAHSALR